jgi:hypothetical protein
MKHCGAKTRKPGGASCRLKGVGKGGRCRFHGGRSSGPKTTEGRARIAEAARKRWEQYRAEHPRLFTNEITARQENRIRKAFREQWDRRRTEHRPQREAIALTTVTPEQAESADEQSQVRPSRETRKGRQVEVRIECQPIHRLRRLEREATKEDENAHGLALIQYYSQHKEKPTSYLTRQFIQARGSPLS